MDRGSSSCGTDITEKGHNSSDGCCYSGSRTLWPRQTFGSSQDPISAGGTKDPIRKLLKIVLSVILN